MACFAGSPHTHSSLVSPHEQPLAQICWLPEQPGLVLFRAPNELAWFHKAAGHLHWLAQLAHAFLPSQQMKALIKFAEVPMYVAV